MSLLKDNDDLVPCRCVGLAPQAVWSLNKLYVFVLPRLVCFSIEGGIDAMQQVGFTLGIATPRAMRDRLDKTLGELCRKTKIQMVAYLDNMYQLK